MVLAYLLGQEAALLAELPSALGELAAFDSTKAAAWAAG